MKYTILFVFFFLAILSVSSHAQISFEKNIHVGNWSQIYAITEGKSGGFFLAGVYSMDPRGRYERNGFIMKCDGNGNILWNLTIGKLFVTPPFRFLELKDSNLIFIGSDDTNLQYLLKCTPDGNVLWSYYVEVAGSDLIEAPDNGFIIAGTSHAGEHMLTFFDKDGQMTNVHGYASQSFQFILNAVRTSENEYVIASNHYDALLLSKLNSAGEIRFMKQIRSGKPNEIGTAMIKTSDGGFAVCGGVEENLSDTDVYLIRFDSTGNLLWDVQINLLGNEKAICLAETENGDILLAGYHSRNIQFNSPTDSLFLVRVSKDAKVRSSSISTFPNTSTYPRTLIRSKDNTLILLGNLNAHDDTVFSDHSFFMIKFKNESELCNFESSLFTIKNIGIKTDSIYLTEEAYPFMDSVKIESVPFLNYRDSDLCSISSVKDIIIDNFFLSLSPNPTTGIIAVHNAPPNITKVTILNILGESILEISPNSSDFTLDLSQLPAGTYFAGFVVGGEVVTRKIVKE